MGSQLLANANNEWISSLASLAGSAIVFHDHLITVSQEVQFVWGRRWTSVNLLFYLNRWITLLWACLNVAILFPMVSPNACVAMNNSFAVCQALLQIIWPFFSSIRVYAVSNGSIVLSGIVFAAGMAAAVAGIVNNLAMSIYRFDATFVAITAGYTNCTQIPQSQAALKTLTYAAPACCILAETTVLSITCFKTYMTSMYDSRKQVQSPLMQMLFTSGILSFSTLLMFNIFAMLATVNEVLKHASLFTIPMSSVIISRFLLGLREVASSTVQHKLGTTNSSALRSRFSVQSAISSIGFASVVGNMGELLRSGDDDEDYDLTWSDAPYGTKIQQDVASVAEMQSVGLTPDFEMIHFDERPSKSP